MFFMDNKDTTISVYRVFSDKRVFIEVEARHQDKVDQIVSILRKHLSYKLKNIDKSLYKLFVKANPSVSCR